MKTKLFTALLAAVVLSSCSSKESIGTFEYKADEEASAIEWKGSAPDHFHEGAFKVSATIQTNSDGKITAGEFKIPIASITNYDIPDETVKEQLINHLLSPDFFNVALHPNAHFKITGVEEYQSAETNVNYLIIGDFSLLGQTHTIKIPAFIKVENNQISAVGSFILDRHKWGMNSYNDPAAPLYILPEVDIKLNLKFKKSN